MEKFKIPIQWSCYGEVEVEASSLDEALDEVNLNSDEVILPQDWSLVEGSVEVNFEEAEDFNPGHKMSEEPVRRELEAKDFGIQDKDPQKVFDEARKIEGECGDPEEREARRHLDQRGEGYEQDAEDEGGDEEG